jgi:hypothetical protein
MAFILETCLGFFFTFDNPLAGLGSRLLDGREFRQESLLWTNDFLFLFFEGKHTSISMLLKRKEEVKKNSISLIEFPKNRLSVDPGESHAVTTHNKGLEKSIERWRWLR